MDRRQFLQGFGAATVATVSLSTVGAALANLPAAALSVRQDPMRDRGSHAISRLTFGITPALHSHLRQIGAEAFIAEQLAPDRINDDGMTAHLEPYAHILEADLAQLVEQFAERPQQAAVALIGNWVLRALYSERQLLEKVTQFFSNHFYVYLYKGPFTAPLLIRDERDYLRPYAFSNFRTMLGYSGISPSMLLYLDNAQNNRRAPNENYARELLELHTLGVHGGYTETDVKEVARAFTGWSVRFPREGEGTAFEHLFRRAFHDRDAKTILGTLIQPDGQNEGERVYDLLAAHPSTARFISTKLVRRFVADAPPDALVTRLSEVYQSNAGAIPPLLTTLFAADEFWNAAPKLKTPFEYTMSVLRALGFEIINTTRFMRGLGDVLEAMGNTPFMWPAPNGFPDVAGLWSGSLITRWNIALAAVTDQVPGARLNGEGLIDLWTSNGVPLEADPVIDFMAGYLLGRPLTADERPVMLAFARTGTTPQEQIAFGIALLLASPAFQYR